MNVLQPLIDSARMAPTRFLWDEGVAQEAFALFFACTLAHMSRQSHFLDYQAFLEDTQSAFEAASGGGVVSVSLLAFWEKDDRKILRQKIAEAILVDADRLSLPLVLGLHSGFETLCALSRAQNKSAFEWINAHLLQIAQSLPSWAPLVVDKAALARIDADRELLASPKPKASPSLDWSALLKSDPNQKANDQKDKDDANEAQAIAAEVAKRKAKQEAAKAALSVRMNDYPSRSGRRSWASVVFLLGFLSVATAVGYYYLSASNKSNRSAALASATPAKEPAYFSVTAQGSGRLYACHARVGSVALSNRLVGLLEDSFADAFCAIDVDSSYTDDLRLDGVGEALALLSETPYASLEMVGNNVYINAPSASDTQRLVAGVGGLLPALQTQAMRPIDAADIKNADAKAVAAINALPASADMRSLVNALNKQIIDGSNHRSFMNHEALKLAGARLKDMQNERLLVVARSDAVTQGNANLLRAQTQITADAIKRILVQNGAQDAQVVAIGVGADFPLADNQTDIGRAKNRRVEFLVYDNAVARILGRSSAEAHARLQSSSAQASVFDVVDGQIVQRDPNAPAFAPEPLPSDAQTPQNYAPQSDVYDGYATNYASPEAYLAPPAQTEQYAPAPRTQSIDPDLLKPLSADAFGDGASAEIQKEY